MPIPDTAELWQVAFVCLPPRDGAIPTTADLRTILASHPDSGVTLVEPVDEHVATWLVTVPRACERLLIADSYLDLVIGSLRMVCEMP